MDQTSENEDLLHLVSRMSVHRIFMDHQEGHLWVLERTDQELQVEDTDMGLDEGIWEWAGKGSKVAREDKGVADGRIRLGDIMDL